jgi:virginiamycin A acetyltransferase
MMFAALRHRVARKWRRSGAPNVWPSALVHESTVGDYAYVGPECRIFQTEIGAFVSLGPRVIIGETEHLTEHDFLSNNLLTVAERAAYDANKSRITILEPDCWVCAGAVVRKGVRIGRGAVVGAGAVVVGDVPPYAIVGGVPAKLIRMRFDPAHCAALDVTRWWELPPAVLLASRRDEAIPVQDNTAESDL